MRWLTLLALVAVAGTATLAVPRLVAHSAAPARPATLRVAAGYYGVNAQLALGAGAARTWRRSAAQIARLGVGTVRRDAFWSAIEPLPPRRGRHRYRWRATDRLVAALAASGLRWYPIVDYGVAWASGGDWRDPPTADHVGDYGAFAAALAGRYGVHGAFWRRHPRLRAAPVHELEVWNEPNVARFWPDQLDAPARLAAMYLAARERVKTVDPPARVVLGGLSAIDLDAFLAGMVQASPQLVGHLDAVGFHPYGGGPDAGLQLTYARIRDLRAALSRLFPGERVPIEVTETGWAVPPVPEAWRARRLRRLALELPRSNCDVTRLIVHTWTSADRGASPEAWFGIAYPNGRLRPSGAAFRAGVLSARRDDPASAAGALTC